MQPSPEYASEFRTRALPGASSGERAAYLAYQGVTIAAMVMLLASLWAF